MKWPLLAVLYSSAVLFSGCAWTSVRPLAPGDCTTPGFRYYDPKPILIVDTVLVDKQPALRMEIKFIPNMSRAYAVRYHSFLVKHDASLTLSNGMLGAATDNRDPTAVVNALLGVAKAFAPVGLASKADDSGAVASWADKAGVYEFIFDDAGNLCELRRVRLTAPC